MQAEGRDPLRRAGIGARQGRAARADGDLRGRRAGARHLLRRAGHGAAARRQGRGRPSPRIRPRRGRGDEERRRCSTASGRSGERYPVWMSHGDRVTKPPQGFAAIGTSPNAPIAMIADEARKFYATQFHLEVVHTPHGAALLRNFVRKIAGCTGDWTMRAFKDEAIDKIRRAGRQGQGDLRAVRRRRFRGRRGAHPRGDRRPAHLRVRRSRPAAARRRRRRCVALFRGHYNIPLVHVDAADDFPRSADGRRGSGGKAQDHRQIVHRRVRGRSEEDRGGANSSPRARSIPT